MTKEMLMLFLRLIRMWMNALLLGPLHPFWGAFADPDLPPTSNCPFLVMLMMILARKIFEQKLFNPSACNFHYIIITQSLWCEVHLRLWTPALQFGPLSPIHLCTVMICIFISLRPFLTFWNRIYCKSFFFSPPHEEWGEHCLSKVLERIAVNTLQCTFSLQQGVAAPSKVQARI